MRLGILTEAIMLITGTLDSKVTGTGDGSQAMKKVKAVATYTLGHSQYERHPSNIYRTQIRFVNFVRAYVTNKVTNICAPYALRLYAYLRQ